MEIRVLLELTRVLIMEEALKRRNDPANCLTVVSFHYWVKEAAKKHGYGEEVAAATLVHLRRMTLELGTGTHDVFSRVEALELMERAESIT